MKAFVLGAGLGTRLRPLTARRPKPMVPIYGRPLISLGFDHLIANGITSFVVNTHHCPESYVSLCGPDGYRGLPVEFRHEPTLLETGGGIKNVEDLIGDAPFLCYNGDILADFPLRPAVAQHLASAAVATLVLRPFGGPLHIQARDGRVTGIRNPDSCDPSFLFTGITILSPEIFRHIPVGEIVSIIPIYAELIRRGAVIGAHVVEEGHWLDLGTRDAYLAAHQLFQPGGAQLSYAAPDWPRTVDPTATVSASVRMRGACSIGQGASIGDGALLDQCVVWENAVVQPGAQLTRCIVRDGEIGERHATDRDF